jgi:tricarballylate dehydrogenase
MSEFCTTMRWYNEATETGDFDPMRLDGLNTEAKLKVPKTNWALLLDKPPYMAHGVTCGMAPLSYRVFGFRMTGSPATGITFTYTGLKRDTLAHVLNNEGLCTLGLWAAGEISDGFFAFNYPRGVGLPRGASVWTDCGRREQRNK